MATPRIRNKVHEAVLSLARENQVGAITMEGIAARASVSKQTLYRTWPSTGAVLFDALLAGSTNAAGVVAVPNSGDVAADLLSLASATVAELTDPTQEPLLRAVTAEIQTDEDLAALYRDLLFRPQFDGIADRLRQGNWPDPDAATELFLGPIFHRWLLRTGPLDPAWIAGHVTRTLRASS
ncbi:TetR family transcriptional regulator [Williamsia sp. 1138]|uniref:TetR-like C-terminal domain-containing protein n=1 Tax=Williamsia sp. 1138 TaxID=1903117 RepID=UPI000A102C92|nr:TetR-like C-terminal domain-containing protein [Williamsia sp. 1138]OZG27712.1 TetR family transcriptional regulator [Williamsia sp. 1138]